MIIGYYQRERNGNIYVDLGKTEGILPKKFQSPREDYHPNDRIKAMIYEVAKTPRGACVGLKGVRIQAVVREMEGEKIDVLRYSLDPRTFIKNALSPAEVSQGVIVDDPRQNAVAVVPDAAFSLAIGKGGLNVRLAHRLTDWNIDVKTETQ